MISVPAGAAKFKQRYDDAERYGYGCKLARRLHFTPWADGGDTAAYRRSDDDAWNVWRPLMLLLSYQRLVGAGRVRRRRHKSKEWRRDDTARRTAVMRSGWAPPLPSAAPLSHHIIRYIEYMQHIIMQVLFSYFV